MATPMPRRIQRFELLQHLGTGGMGSVYRARDPQLERDVAIKLLVTASAGATSVLSPGDTLDLRDGGASSPDDLLHEARMMAQLSHPNVLPVYEVGLEGGEVFVVMEHVDGSDLQAWLEQSHSDAEILDVFAQAGRGLAAAHARGIVHRDFKPGNVLIGTDGRVRVADFGLSRLTARPTTAMIRIDDGRGTPRYMAPELWDGALATTSSDVYAFCATLGEALGGEPGRSIEDRDRVWRARGVSPELRAALAAGTAAAPAARPELARVLAVLAVPRAQGPRRYAVVGAIAAVSIAAGVILALTTGGGSSSSSAAACVVDTTLFDGRWDDARRAALRQALEPTPSPRTHGVVERIVKALDKQRSSTETELAATCAATQQGELTAAQARVRTSCLERIAYEVGAIARYATAHKIEPEPLMTRVNSVTAAESCRELTAPPLPADRAPILAFYDQLQAHDDLATREGVTALVEQYTVLEREAVRLGEPVVAARCAFGLGVSSRFLDKLPEADAHLQRAYRTALETHAYNIATIALLERSDVLRRRGDAKTAASLADLARDLADRPATPPSVRARVYHALGNAAASRGDLAAALPFLETALTTLGPTNHDNPYIELDIRYNVFGVLSGLKRNAAALAFARETVAVTKATLGEHTGEYVDALSTLASALLITGDRAGSVATRRQALALAIELSPPGSSIVLGQRTSLAAALGETGAYEEALRDLRLVVDEAEHNKTTKAWRPWLYALVGQTTFQVGQYDEAMRWIGRAIEEATSISGKDHPETLQYRAALVDDYLQLGRVEEAAQQLELVEAGYHERGETPPILVQLRGSEGSTIALGRGKPREAEALTRTALATWDEVKGDDEGREMLYQALGTDLIAEQRWADARAAFDKAIELANARHAREDDLAGIDVKLASIEAALGHPAEAIARARRARDILDRYPGAVADRREVAAFLRSPRSHGRARR